MGKSSINWGLIVGNYDDFWCQSTPEFATYLPGLLGRIEIEIRSFEKRLLGKNVSMTTFSGTFTISDRGRQTRKKMKRAVWPCRTNMDRLHCFSVQTRGRKVSLEPNRENGNKSFPKLQESRARKQGQLCCSTPCWFVHLLLGFEACYVGMGCMHV